MLAIAKKNIQDCSKDYFDENDIKTVILGMSGGIDSTIMAALMNELDVTVVGISLPTDSNEEDEITRARLAGEAFCDKFTEFGITSDFEEEFESVKLILHNIGKDYYDMSSHEQKIIQGNIKARLRMIKLYAVAGATKGLVLSTDNYTELMLGFWTLHGDVGDFGAIQNLWKSEVYQLAKYMVGYLKDDKKIALQSSIDAICTDGNGINTDLDQIGLDSYAAVDYILKCYFKDPKTNLDSPIIHRHLNTRYKRNNPFNIPRADITHIALY